MTTKLQLWQAEAMCRMAISTVARVRSGAAQPPLGMDRAPNSALTSPDVCHHHVVLPSRIGADIHCGSWCGLLVLGDVVSRRALANRE
jgi:hypothetical protein